MKKYIIFIMIVYLSSTICFAIVNNLIKEEKTLDLSVEVAPDKFINYQKHKIYWKLEHESFAAVHILPTQKALFFQKDTFYLSIPWNSQEIFFIGVGVPISIRSYEDKLYMIVFDRESDFNKCRFRYYKQNHNVLAEIEPKDYPKEIAIQNLWLLDEGQLEVVRNLDPDDPVFCRSLTAKIWYQLEEGKEYYEARTEPMPSSFLSEYLKKYTLIKLDKVIQ